MSINFPTSLDDFTNPTPASQLNTPAVLHSTQHSNLNDAVEALEVKVGVNSSTDTGSLDYRTTALEASSHAAVTIGTANGLSLSGQQVSLGLASSSDAGALSAADWTTFNSKAAGNHTHSYLPLAGGTMTGNIGLTEGLYIGYPSVIGSALVPTDASYNGVWNSLNNIFINLDSGAGGSLHVLKVGKGRTTSASTDGIDVFQVDTNGFFSFYLENSFMGYPGSAAQGISPFDSGFNFLVNSLNDIYLNVDSGNTQTTRKIIFAKNGTAAAGVTEIASISEAGAFTLNAGSIVTDTTTGLKIGTGATQKLGFFNATPVVQPAAYTASNVSADRSYDANSTSIDELADVLGTLITDLKSLGLIG